MWFKNNNLKSFFLKNTEIESAYQQHFQGNLLTTFIFLYYYKRSNDMPEMIVCFIQKNKI